MWQLRLLWSSAVLFVAGRAALGCALFLGHPPDLGPTEWATDFLQYFRHPAVLQAQIYSVAGVRYAFVDRFDRWSMVAAALLFVASHVVPYRLPGRRLTPRGPLRILEGRSYRQAPPTQRLVTNVAQLDAAWAARATVAGVWAIALSLCIVPVAWTTGNPVTVVSQCVPYGNPAEMMAYHALALVCLASHAPRLLRRSARSWRERGFDSTTSAVMKLAK